MVQETIIGSYVGNPISSSKISSMTHQLSQHITALTLPSAIMNTCKISVNSYLLPCRCNIITLIYQIVIVESLSLSDHSYGVWPSHGCDY
jgi:hypothetical protein